MQLRQRAARVAAMVSVVAALGAGPQVVWAQPSAAPSAPTTAFVVNSLLDAPDANLANPACDSGGAVCTFRAAVQQANATAGPDTITFSVAGSIVLTATTPTITDTVTIVGPGAALLTIDADDTGSVLAFNSLAPAVSFAVSGLTLTGGAASLGGGVFLNGSAPLVISGTVITGNIAEYGGGLRLIGPATLINSTVSHNQALWRGGGIDSTHRLDILNSTIEANKQGDFVKAPVETQGGPNIYSGGGLYVGGIVTMTNSQVLSNSASVANGPAALAAGVEPAAPSGPFGAGIMVDDAVLHIQGSLIAGNYFADCISCPVALAAGSDPAGAPLPVLVGLGAGLFNFAGFVVMTDTQVVSNTAGMGGGLFNSNGFMILVRTLVAGNTANTAGGLAGSAGLLTLTASTVRGNRAIHQDGGGIGFSDGQLIINASDIVGNHAVGNGGGLYLIDGLVQLDGALIQGNASGSFLPVSGSVGQAEPQVATDQGGGLYSAFTTLVVSNTAIVSNTATYGGGVSLAGALTANNTTISGNRANRDGGGLYLATTPLLAAGQPGLVTAPAPIARTDLLHVTLAGNRADANNDATGEGGGLFVTTGTTATLHSTLLADNRDGDGVTAKDCFGTAHSTGYNLVQSTIGCTITATTGDQFNLAGGVQPLQSNGGGTPTNGLFIGSPALDLADPAQCLPADQRGVARPFGAGCDIGAFELGALYLPLLLR